VFSILTASKLTQTVLLTALNFPTTLLLRRFLPFFLGGGFATTFATPSYQETVVNTFLNLKNTSLGNGYNTKGRGYPDVALIGHLYPIVNSGEVQYKDGTSASTPVMAGILSLVNAERLKLKKSSGKYFKRKRASITYIESTCS